MSQQGQVPLGSRVKWWVAGAFTPRPTGRLFRVTPDSYADELARAATGLRVEIPERLGAGATRTVSLSLPRLRSFQLAEVVESLPELRALKILADKLDNQSVEEAVSNLEAVVGAGRLAEAVGTALREARAADAGPAPALPPEAREPDAVDALFARVETTRPQDRARAGVDAFLKSLGVRAASTHARAADASVAQSLVEEAVDATARELLTHPLVARLESAWRGLKLLVEQCPPSSGMALEVLDVEASALEATVEAALPEERFERPDALFVVEPTGDVEWLKRMALLGERAQLPVVVPLSPRLFGADSMAQVRERVEAERCGLPEAWEALRAEPATRWLCVALPRVVTLVEGQGPRRRACFSSPAFAVATMLAASFRFTRGFARILGNLGALQAPAGWTLTESREAGSVVPLEAFIPLRTQSRLADQGVLALGSGRNTLAVQLSGAPMVYGGEHLAPLPAQLLVGRLIRFAHWVRDQLRPGVGGEEVATVFSQAADVFLFGGSAAAGRVQGELVVDAEGHRGVRVDAVVRADHAGMPLELSFTLPLRG